MSQLPGSAATSATLLVTSERFTDHATPPGHPERPERAAVMASVAERYRSSGGIVVEPDAAESGALTRVHAAEYVDLIASTRGRRVRLDPDTYTSAESDAIARVAAGATIAAVDHALERLGRACAFVRPPGHHAERAHAMGFCLFNIQTAARSKRENPEMTRTPARKLPHPHPHLTCLFPLQLHSYPIKLTDVVILAPCGFDHLARPETH